MRAEKKYVTNNDWSAETLDTVGNTPSTNFNTMRLAAGTGPDQRIGLKVYAKYIVAKLLVEQSTSINFDTYRIDVWMDKQPNATNPGWTNLYSTGGAATDFDNITAITSDVSRNRFRLLKSKVVTERALLTSTTGPTVGPNQRFWKWYIPIKKQIRYASTGAGNPDSGCNIFFIGWSTAGSDTPKVYMTTQFCYTDI